MLFSQRRIAATMCVIFNLCCFTSSATGRGMVWRALPGRRGIFSGFVHCTVKKGGRLSANHSALAMTAKIDNNQERPSARSADDYDNLFFVPAPPKPKGSSSSYYRPSYEDEEDDEEVYSTDEKSESNFFDDDDREELIPAQQPTKHVSASLQLKPQAQRYQQYPFKQLNYRAAENQQHQQRQQQQYPRQLETGILSTRAFYQFRPIQPGSTRQMPPTVSESLYDYNAGEENHMNFDDQNEGMTGADVFLHGDNEYDVAVERGQVKRSAKIITKDADKVVDKQAPLQSLSLAPQTSAQKESIPKQAHLKILSSNDSASTNNNSQIYSKTTRNFTPSFMEPPKVKAIIKNAGKADDAPRKLPLEASTGNVSISYIETLSHQLENLQTQIYQLNDGVEFNIGSPKQVAKVLFGEHDEGGSTNKDVLEAMASAGNTMAELIYKWRKVANMHKKELKLIEQREKGDRKNDYYGNLARRDDRQNNDIDAESIKTTGQVDIFDNVAIKVEALAVSDRETLLLIDASAYIFRSYHAMPPLHRTDGTPTGALHGFCRMLQSLLLSQLLKGERPRVVLVFDSKGNNFRHDLYPEYKANRGPCPEDLIPQFDLIKEAASAFGLVQVEAEGYEADDVIATLSRTALSEGMNVDIMSGDKDLWQLVTAPNVEPRLHMVDPGNFDTISHEDVVKKWGVSADKLGDLLALAGDSSDNIKGVPGIGPKIAAQLINEYGSLSELLANTEKIKQKKRRDSLDESAEQVILFRQLVGLDDAIPTERISSSPSFQCVSSVRMSAFDPSKLIDFYERMELRTCKNELERRLQSSRIIYKEPPTRDEYSDVPF